MFVNTQRAQVVGCGHNCLYAPIHTNVPELDLTTPTATDELALAASLQMHIRNPLLVFFPYFDHGRGGLLALIVDANGTITKSSDKNVSFYLV
jgi:hypothetical protein